MRPTATVVVSLSVCVLNTSLSCAKTAEPIYMPFVVVLWGSRNHVLCEEPDLPIGHAQNNTRGWYSQPYWLGSTREHYQFTVAKCYY